MRWRMQRRPRRTANLHEIKLISMAAAAEKDMRLLGDVGKALDECSETAHMFVRS